MKITFSNLGAIKKTTLDLRPLTVIIGPNNSNKTYIAYSIYGLLKALSGSAIGSLLFALGFDIGSSVSPNIESKTLYEIDVKGNYSYKINNSFLSAYKKDCEQIIKIFEDRLNIFFQDGSRNLFKDTKFAVDFNKDELIEALRRIAINNNIFSDTIRAYNYTLEKNTFYAHYVNNKLFERATPNNYVANGLTFDLKSFLYRKPILLPAERNALIITYKILEDRRYGLLKKADRASINQPLLPIFDEPINSTQRRNSYYPKPIEDFIEFLTNLETSGDLQEGNFAVFANTVEEKLQNNNKTNYVPMKFKGREIKINVRKGLDIDLYNASSSIKQLAPLLLYLRYRAKENDLLIIDEPEMNLHPESQAKLLEVLGMLVNAGVNVLLTTHSPYFMSHLNNLIAGDMNDDAVRDKQAKSLYLGDSRAFLKPEDVSAYEMKNNKLVSLKHKDRDGDYSIGWETLSDVSAEIQNKFFEIYEKKEKSSNGEED